MAIARPRPAPEPSSRRRAESARQKRSKAALQRLRGRCPRRCPRRSRAPRRRRPAPARRPRRPPGVWRRALARRLSEHPLEVVGRAARRRHAAASTRDSTRTPRASARAATPRTQPATRPSSAHVAQLERELPRRRCARARRGRPPGGSRWRTWSRIAGRYCSGGASPSSTASSIAWSEASGVRRSWLAWATSSRRASKSRSSSARHAVEGRPQLGELAGTGLGGAGARSPPASASLARRTRSTGPMTERATSSAPTRAAVADARRDREHGQVVPGVEHQHAPDATHGAEGQHDGDRARARSPAPAGFGMRRPAARAATPDRQRARRDRERRGRSRRRTGSRRPRRSGRGCGREGSSSIFSRSRRTWTVTVPVSKAAS